MTNPLFGALPDEGISRLHHALGLGQATRLIQIDTPWAAGTLVVERLTLTEAVHASEPLWAEVDCLSTQAGLAVQALRGACIALRLKLADGRWRSWHAHAVRTAALGDDGGLARYRLSLAAWTHWLSHRRDTRIFQDQRAQDIVSEVFKAYPQARFQWDVVQPGPLRAITTQYRESDWQFAQRLMAQEGWSWRLAHQDGQHTLVIFDEHAEVPDLGVLRYSRPDQRGAGLPGGGLFDLGFVTDTVTAWRQGQRLTPNAVTLAAWDERQLAGVSARSWAKGPQGAVPELEAYCGHGERQHADGRTSTAQPASAAVARARADARMAAHELRQRYALGDSAVRQLHPGARFTLSEHGLHGPTALARQGRGAAAYSVLSVTHEAANNLLADIAPSGQTEPRSQGGYRNHFEAVPAGARLVPQPPAQPTAPGPQSAVVVATEGEPLTSDRDGRIRIQFGWQRGSRPLAAAAQAPLTPAGAETGHAPGDASSGTWVRVAQGLAGPNWGAVFTPRAGTEVLVDFVDGDIDRPLVVGQLHNGQHALPWPAGVDGGAQHPGTLSGWHHSQLDGEGANQWLIDDTTGQLRMRLASHGSRSGWSELSLGHLIAQSGQGGAGQAQRGPKLGEGFYGHTDGWAIVRAGQGLLLSTSARPAQGASVRGTQMDAQEALSQLKAASQLGTTLSHNAQQQGAQGLASFDPGQALQQHTQAMDPQAQGRWEGRVGGQEAQQAQAGRRRLQDPVEKFARPLLHLDTPASALWVTPASISLFSAQDTSFSAQGDVHVASAHALSAVSGQTTSLYTHAGGIKAITAKGQLSLRAHTDAQQIWADQDLTIQSTTDEIRLQARDSIALHAGQSQILLQGGDITMTCPGTWTLKSSTHEWGPGQAAEMPALAALPATALAHIPVPSAQPSLAGPLFSEAMGFEAFPAEWLPFTGVKQVVALKGTQALGHLSAAPSDDVTASLLTQEATQLRYGLALGPGWQVEQGIEVAESGSEAWAAEPEHSDNGEDPDD